MKRYLLLLDSSPRCEEPEPESLDRETLVCVAPPPSSERARWVEMDGAQ